MDTEGFLKYAVLSTILRYELSFPPADELLEIVNPFLFLDDLTLEEPLDGELKELFERYYLSLEGSPYEISNHPWWNEYLSKFGTCDVDYGNLKSHFSDDLLKLFQRMIYASMSVDYHFERGIKAPVSLIVSVEKEGNTATVSMDTVEPFKLLRMGLILFEELVTTQALKMFDPNGENTPQLEDFRNLRLKMWKEKKRICEDLELERLMKGLSF